MYVIYTAIVTKTVIMFIVFYIAICCYLAKYSILCVFILFVICDIRQVCVLSAIACNRYWLHWILWDVMYLLSEFIKQ